MRKTMFLLVGMIFLFFSGCKKDDITFPENENPGSTENFQFVAYYKPGTENIPGDEKLIALITVKNGELSYSAFLNAYLEKSMMENCDINNNIIVPGLKASDFENKGAYMELNDPSAYYLPLVEPPGNNDYSYFQTETGDVSDNGYIIYSPATKDASYGIEYKSFLMKFSPSDGTYKVAISPTSFVVGQPEQESDTEVGQIARTIFASHDGRYAHGSVDALGTQGESIHLDYSILYKYDIETDEYTRLGASDDTDVTIKGITTDRRYILYSNNSDTKLLDLETGNITTTNMNTINVKKNAWGPNGPCVGTSNGDLFYKYFVNNNESVVCSSPGYGWVYNTMFSKNGNNIYFLLEGNNENYVCVTNGILEGSSYDTTVRFLLSSKT